MNPKLTAALRWTGALLVFAAVGTGAAYAVTDQDRGDLPGLATRSDGRWDYPRLARPALPVGVPHPYETANRAQSHYADLRKLVLPAPAGATADPVPTGRDGWLPAETYLKEYAAEDRQTVRRQLDTDGLRNIAARGWTMPDGTRTRIYLLHFNTGAFTGHFLGTVSSALAPNIPLAGAEHSRLDPGWPSAAHPPHVETHVFEEQRPYGAEQVRTGYVRAGDVLAVVLERRAADAPAVPFRQTVILQSQLLG